LSERFSLKGRCRLNKRIPDILGIGGWMLLTSLGSAHLPLPATAAPVRKKAVVKKAPAKKASLVKRALPSRRAGYVVGRAVNSQGKPLAGVRIRVFGTTTAGERTNFETKTGTNGTYAVRLPRGNYHVGWAHYLVAAPSGPSYALPLHPNDGDISDQDSGPGIIENFTLKIAGRISSLKDAGSDLSYYGGTITVEGGALEKGDFLSGYNYRFPQGSAVELTLTPKGALADGSAGRTLVLRRPVERGYIAEFLDVPIGQYQVVARLVQADGAVQPLRVAVARPMSGTSPSYATPAASDFAATGTLYFPSRGDSIPLLTYGGAAKAPLYVQP
jgi:hypothetical protein